MTGGTKMVEWGGEHHGGWGGALAPPVIQLKNALLYECFSSNKTRTIVHIVKNSEFIGVQYRAVPSFKISVLLITKGDPQL